MTKEADTKEKTLLGTKHVGSLTRFLTDLECLRDLYLQVVPILEETDKERRSKAKALISKYAKPDPSDLTKIIAELPTEENKIFIETIRKIERASTLFRCNLLVSVVARYEEYFAEQLRLTLSLHPERFASSDKSMPYREIATWGGNIEPIEIIVSREVDDIMRTSAEDQLKHIDKELKLGLFIGFPDIAMCIEACERRNLYAHTGGVVSRLYLDKLKGIGYKWKDGKGPDAGVRIGVNEEYFDRTVDVFTILGVRLTQGILRRSFPEEKELADDQLLEVGFSKLESEHYGLAERIFDFALEVPDKFTASDLNRKIFLVNRCIALYYQNRKEDMDKILGSVDWGAMHPKFVLAVHVLREQWADAVSLMHKADLSEREFVNWPLFRAFRKTEGFRLRFKELFGKEITYEPRTDEEANKAPEPTPTADTFSSAQETRHP